MTACFAYVTCDSEDEAQAIAGTIVEERLAACANVIPGMTSVYRWEGRIEQGAETVLIFKTQAALVERLTARVRSLHSYDCPCVVALPVAGGNPAFLDWIAAETDADTSDGGNG